MISKFSVKKPYTILVGVVMIIILGIVSFMRMTTDLLPNINLPYVIVMTTYVGASPETVESVVTQPIESSMATVSNIEGLNSVSNENYSMVIMEFSQNANMDSVSLEIRENLDQLKSIWDDAVGNPVIMKINPDMMPVMVAAVGVEGMTNAQISEYATSYIIPELESIEGVASATASGLIEESVHVLIRQDKIDAINLNVFGSIDREIDESLKELQDGKKEIAEGWDEINNNIAELAESRQKITEGLQEITDGKADLASGKAELESQKTNAIDQIASGSTKLIDAKSQIVSGKTLLSANIMQMEQGLAQAEEGKSGLELALGGLDQMATAINMIISNNADDFAVQSQANILDPSIRTTLTQLGVTHTDDTTLAELTATIHIVKAGYESQRGELNVTIEGLVESLAQLKAQYAELEIQEKQVDEALTELTKGQLEAASGFGSGEAQLAFGETQLESAKTQLESAEEQIESGEEQINTAKDQLRDAEAQIKDAEEQIEEAREDAYMNANMTGVLTVEMVSSLLMAQNFSMPSGYVTEDGVDYLIRVGNKPETVEELLTLPLLNLNMDGVDIITLADVADVFMTDNADEVYTNVNGNPGVMISIQKQTGYSTGDVSDKLADRFKELERKNSDLSLIALMDQGIYIDLVMNSILNNIVFGGVLAILVLLLFLKDIRPTLVIAFSIPVSLVAAIVCMYFSGVTLNIISLSGLALGIGMLVDNSIVVIENIYRLRHEGHSMRDAAIMGSKEVAGAIIASTLTTVCVFLPIVFTEGLTRQLFVDMGLTIAFSLGASLVIALTVVPAMASVLLTTTKEQKATKLGDRIMNGYEKALRVVLSFKPIILIAVVVLFISSIFAALSNGTAFMSDMDSNQFSMTITTPDGSTLKETGDITDEIVDRVMQLPDIVDAGAMTGGSSTMMGMGSSDSTTVTTIYLTTLEEKSKTNEELANDIRDLLADIEAIELEITTSSMDMSMLTGNGVSIEVRGREIDTLQTIAMDIAKIIEKVEGTVEVSNGLEDATQEVRVIIDHNKAIDKGLTVAQVFSQIASKLADPSTATTLDTGIRDYDVFVLNEKDLALSRETVQDIEIEYTDKEGKKAKVLLKELASFEISQGVDAVNRVDQTRYIAVSAGIAEGYNVGIVSEKVTQAIAEYEMPEGYTLVFSGENEMIMDAMEQVALMMILALAFMYLIMVAQFQSLLSPFIIMFTIPLAFTGGFLGLYLSGSEVSVIAMIGFVMLAGIIVNNGIVLVDYINHLREHGMEKREAIVLASKTRLRPVFMTALTTVLALSTMVFSSDMGSEMGKPMAIVTIGGLVYGTLLTLFIIPTIYEIFNRKKYLEQGNG